MDPVSPSHIKWQEHVPNTTVLKICNISVNEALLQTAQLQWCGHVIRMDNTRSQAGILWATSSWLSASGWAVQEIQGLSEEHNDSNVASHPLNWKLAMDRAGWRFTCKSAVEEFEVRCIQELEAKRLRKSDPPSTSNLECQICHRMCRSRIGLLAHNKSHS